MESLEQKWPLCWVSYLICSCRSCCYYTIVVRRAQWWKSYKIRLVIEWMNTVLAYQTQGRWKVWKTIATNLFLVIPNFFNFSYSYILEVTDLWDLYKCGFHYTQYLFIWNGDKSLPVEFIKFNKTSLAQRLLNFQSRAVSIS